MKATSANHKLHNALLNGYDELAVNVAINGNQKTIQFALVLMYFLRFEHKKAVAQVNVNKETSVQDEWYIGNKLTAVRKYEKKNTMGMSRNCYLKKNTQILNLILI